VTECQSTSHSLKLCDELSFLLKFTIPCHGSLFILALVTWMDLKLLKKLIQCRLCSVKSV